MEGGDELDLILAEQLHSTRIRLRYAKLTSRFLKNDKLVEGLESLITGKICFLERMIENKLAVRKTTYKYNLFRNFSMLKTIIKHNRRVLSFFSFDYYFRYMRVKDE